MSLSFSGVWSATTTYKVDNIVSFNGSSYVSLVGSNLNNSPDVSPSQWQVLAAQGPAGATGASGSVGPTGATGPQGPAGISNLFSTTTPGGSLSLPPGNYFVAATVIVTLSVAQSLSQFQGGSITFNLFSSHGIFATGIADGFIPGGGLTSDSVGVTAQGVLILSTPDTVSISCAIEQTGPEHVNVLITGLQLQAIQVGSITQQ
jgi:hypothetical protein